MTFCNGGRKLIQRKSTTESKLFISYRRDDGEGQAGRLYDRLNAAFPGRVFRDVSGIEIGVDFAGAIQRAIASSVVLVAVIGRQWASLTDAAGERRIMQPGDYVRLEIATALARKLPIFPVLVDGARMPSPQELPEDINALSGINAVTLTAFDYDHLVEGLIAALRKLLGQTDPQSGRENIDKLLARAEASIAAEDWMAAKQALQSALSLDPSDSVAASRLRFAQENLRLSGLYADAQRRLANGDRAGALAGLRQIRASAGPYKDVDQLIGRFDWELRPPPPAPPAKKKPWIKWVVAAFVAAGLIEYAVEQADRNGSIVQPRPSPIYDAPFSPEGQWVLFIDPGPGPQLQVDFMGDGASGRFTMRDANVYEGDYRYASATRELILNGSKNGNFPYSEQIHIDDWKDNHFHVSIRSEPTRRWALRRVP
ncbi:MAG: toll/interleukin-1 receptor domain-containing protein [Acidobacteriota bacterium]|nr:toll/interleukin-1 receptor domain-containing protein [Acidobacteriota bacterium]